MGLFGLFKKEKAPEALPDLAFDDVPSSKEDTLDNDSALISTHLQQEEKNSSAKTEKSVSSLPSPSLTAPVSKPSSVTMPSKSFFDELQKDITGELDNLERLEEWYEHKFLPQDIVSNMRRYWEGQKANSVLQILGKNFKDRINQKTAELQVLEKEWQNSYFDLIEKEEEIKEHEQDLKLILSEFVEVCKRKKRSLGETNNEQKKTKTVKTKTSR